MKKLYFVVGSQDLYGEECLKQVAADAREMAEYLNEKLEGIHRRHYLDAHLLPGQDVDQGTAGA